MIYMKEEGILKGAGRVEPTWNKIKLGEPFKDALDRFRDDVLEREDFDPTSLLQFGLFMSKAVINILEEAENLFGIDGQRMVNNALIKTGYDMGNEIVKDLVLPPDIPEIEIISFLTTIVNTHSWTSIEAPRIDSEEQCSFDIIWCPLQDIYSAFDCRVQRYLVQGVINAFRDTGKAKSDYQVEFKKTIPAGAEKCVFCIKKKKPEEPDKWEQYTQFLERRAMKKQQRKKI